MFKGGLAVLYTNCLSFRTKDGCTPLMLAAREGHYKVADWLLRSGAKVNVPSGSENNIPLTLACWKGNFLPSFIIPNWISGTLLKGVPVANRIFSMSNTISQFSPAPI